MSTLHVQTLLGGKLQSLHDVDLDKTTLRDIRHKISPPFPSYDPDPAQLPQRWLHRGRELTNDQTPLQQLSIKPNDTLVLLLKLDATSKSFLTVKQVQALEAWKRRNEEEKKKTRERAEELLRERQRQLQERERMRRQGGQQQQQQQQQQQAQQMPQRIPKLDEIPFDNEFFQTQMAIVMSMGFENERRVKKALLLNNMNADAAINWLMDNSYRQDYLDQELTQDEYARVVQFFQQYLRNRSGGGGGGGHQ